MTRDQKVLALGRTLLEYLPQARSPSSALGTSPGLAASRYVPCETCGARGSVSPKGQPCASCPPLLGEKAGRKSAEERSRHGCRPCSVCEATGWRKRRKGDPEWDAVARVPIQDQDRKENAQTLDAKLRHTERLLALWERPNSVGYRWEEQRRRMERSGSYRELGEALRKLERIAPRRFATWWRLVVCGEMEFVILGERMREQLVATTKLLAAMMPAEIRMPRELREESANAARKQSLAQGKSPAHARLRSERDSTILQMAEGEFDGRRWKVSQIARHYSLTERRVKQVLAEQRGRNVPGVTSVASGGAA